MQEHFHFKVGLTCVCSECVCLLMREGVQYKDGRKLYLRIIASDEPKQHEGRVKVRCSPIFFG